MTQQQILEVQRRAVERNDQELLEVAWGALGYSRRYSFAPVTGEEKARCLERCAAELAQEP